MRRHNLQSYRSPAAAMAKKYMSNTTRLWRAARGRPAKRNTVREAEISVTSVAQLTQLNHPVLVCQASQSSTVA